MKMDEFKLACNDLAKLLNLCTKDDIGVVLRSNIYAKDPVGRWHCVATRKDGSAQCEHSAASPLAATRFAVIGIVGQAGVKP